MSQNWITIQTELQFCFDLLLQCLLRTFSLEVLFIVICWVYDFDTNSLYFATLFAKFDKKRKKIKRKKSFFPLSIYQLKNHYPCVFRCSYWSCSAKTVLLKFCKILGKTHVLVSLYYFQSCRSPACNFIRKKAQPKVFYVNFSKILRYLF